MLVSSLLLLLGCDPGIAIRQALNRQKEIGNPANGDELILQVFQYRTLAYSSIYVARMSITNRSDAELTVDRMELITRHGDYSNDEGASHGLPATLEPKKTADLEGFFNLGVPLHDTFNKPAELRVYYHTGIMEKAVSTNLSAAR